MIIPTTHRIIVKQKQLEQTRPEYKRAEAMGIVIPDTEDKKRAQAGVDQGFVVAFGPTAFRDYDTACPIVKGDLVAFAKYSGKVITDPEDNEEYVALNDEDIVAILKEKESND